MAPPARAIPIAVRIASSVPTHSRTEWTPRPPASVRTRATASSPRSFTTSVAPNSFARAIRSGWWPRIMIRSAPRRRAAMTAQRPTAPSPMTATVLPHAPGGLARLHQFVRPEIAAADAGAADGDQRVGRLDQAGVGDILDANVPGAVHDSCAHRDLPLRIHIV